MISRGKAEKRQARGKRLSAALRENLKRRKAQARGRAESVAGEGARPPTPAQPPSPDFRRNRGSE
jgi:hypothetical protein